VLVELDKVVLLLTSGCITPKGCVTEGINLEFGFLQQPIKLHGFPVLVSVKKPPTFTLAYPV
jgi:hypothetical protein